MIADESGINYPDNGERAVFFARGVLETVKKLRWVPDIIHCQGWMSAVVPLYIKTAYQDEPSFANTKVVTSLFAKNLTNDLGTNFKKCVEFRETTADLLTPYKDNFDFEEMGKLAIDYSDGVIMGSPDADKNFESYAAAKNIPVLGYKEDFAESYETLYNQICPEED
jgi:starch synthase